MKKIFICICFFWVNLTFAHDLKIDKVIGYDHFVFKDESRKKDIPITIYYPVLQTSEANIKDIGSLNQNYVTRAPIREKKKYPFIMISHGWTGDEKFLSWLSDAFVSAGFITCIVKHNDAQDFKNNINYYNRALDISNSLTYLLGTRNARYIDQEKIGLTGYSLGGTTAVWLIGGIANNYDAIIHPDPTHGKIKILPPTTKNIVNISKFKASYQDNRFKAALLLSPTWGEIFVKKSLKMIKKPTLIIDALNIKIINPEYNSLLYARNIPNALLKFVPGNHFVFRSVKGKANEPKGVNRQTVHKQVSTDAVFFFKQIFDKNSMYNQPN